MRGDRLWNAVGRNREKGGSAADREQRVRRDIVIPVGVRLCRILIGALTITPFRSDRLAVAARRVVCLVPFWGGGIDPSGAACDL
jgi:hypothetical protein